MSCVLLLAADKPLPLCDERGEVTHTVTVQGKAYTVTAMGGFSVNDHRYYRHAVEKLGYEMKPFQYELDLRPVQEDLEPFKAYMERQFSSGEEVQLWNLWVGNAPGPLTCLRGEWKDFDLDTLKQFDRPGGYINAPGQCRMTLIF